MVHDHQSKGKVSRYKTWFAVIKLILFMLLKKVTKIPATIIILLFYAIKLKSTF